MMGSDGDGVAEIATSCGGEWLSQAPASVVSTSSMTVKSAASALSEIWTRTVARRGSWGKLTWRSACQDSVATWTEAPAISMQGRGPVENSPRAKTAATANGTTEARRLKRNMTLPTRHRPATGAYGWQRVNVTGYFRVDGKLHAPGYRNRSTCFGFRFPSARPPGPTPPAARLRPTRGRTALRRDAAGRFFPRRRGRPACGRRAARGDSRAR